MRQSHYLYFAICKLRVRSVHCTLQHACRCCSSHPNKRAQKRMPAKDDRPQARWPFLQGRARMKPWRCVSNRGCYPKGNCKLEQRWLGRNGPSQHGGAERQNSHSRSCEVSLAKIAMHSREWFATCQRASHAYTRQLSDALLQVHAICSWPWDPVAATKVILL